MSRAASRLPSGAVLRFLELMNWSAPVVHRGELETKLGAELTAVLRDARIVVPHSPARVDPRDAYVEISYPDFVRLLRALYDVDPRGLSSGPIVDLPTFSFGWTGEGKGEREVVLVGRHGRDLDGVLIRDRRILALVPLARFVRPEVRAKHGPEAKVEIRVLEEDLVVKDGRIVRLSAPPAEGDDAPRGPSRLPGVTRWNEVTVYLAGETMVRIDGGGRTLRRTCADLGMAHGTSREPTKVWHMLTALCEGHGHLSTSRFGGVAATKKLVSRFRQAMREHLGIAGDPLHPYVRGAGWRTRFVAEPELPEEG